MKRRGFTLIEVLVALALLALVVSLIQGVFSGVVRSRDHLQGRTEEAHAAAILLQKITDELAATYTFTQSPRTESTTFVVKSGSDSTSSLEFSASLPEYLQVTREKKAASGPLARISYSVEDVDGTRTLMRRESRDLDRGLEGAEDPDPMFRGVVRFRVLCSMDGKEWDERWDSTSRPATDLLPKIVSVEISWREGNRESAPEQVLRTAIPIYGWL